MLILERKLEESVFLGLGPNVDRDMTLGELFENGAIEIKVTKIEGAKIKLAIEAPEPISIIRAELLDKKHGTDFPPHEPVQDRD